MRVRVFVTLKPSVFDPQGTTVAEALHTLGYGTVSGVRQGKYFELDVDAASVEQARSVATGAADQLLANPVIESYRIEVDGAGGGVVKFAVVVFPGSNCDHDAYHAAKHVLGQDAAFVWHKDTSLGNADAVILPGGFAHGDYLRTGAIARFSPVMAAVKAFAAAGGPVIGICNGFQVLLEAGLLPGAMLRNDTLRFRCEHVHVRIEHRDTPFTAAGRVGQVLRLPIAHGEGNYFADPATIEALERNRQVIFRYVTAQGEVTPHANPNGSAHNIAGLCSEGRNVVGLMPHPERACEAALGSADGLVILESVVQVLGAGGGVPLHSESPAGSSLHV